MLKRILVGIFDRLFGWVVGISVNIHHGREYVVVTNKTTGEVHKLKVKGIQGKFLITDMGPFPICKPQFVQLANVMCKEYHITVNAEDLNVQSEVYDFLITGGLERFNRNTAPTSIKDFIVIGLVVVTILLGIFNYTSISNLNSKLGGVQQQAQTQTKGL